MWNLDTTNMAQTSDGMITDNPKGYYSVVPIEMWYRRAWTYQGMGFSEALYIIREVMLRWRRRKLMRYYCRVLSWSSSVWRRFFTSRGGKRVVNNVCVGRYRMEVIHMG